MVTAACSGEALTSDFALGRLVAPNRTAIIAMTPTMIAAVRPLIPHSNSGAASCTQPWTWP